MNKQIGIRITQKEHIMFLGQRQHLHFILVMFFLCASLLVAGTTGKIAGRVVDSETREPLVGVNVVVKGTTLGATTDIEGFYTILLVPPGVHTVTASMVGYSSVTVNDVRVLIDQTATVNVELPQEAIRMGDIVVVAERNIVKKDVATSVAAVQADELQALPAIQSLNNIIGLNAGVEDGLRVRGGDADQLLLQIDGVTMRDPRNNKPISSIALSSVQQVSVERGGFNAEYGQVRSGIVNVIGREGDISRYFGQATVRYSPPTPKHFGISVYDPNSMWNRPYLDDAVAWTGTRNGVWDYYTARQYPEFEGWNAISERLLSDNDPKNDLSPAATQALWKWQHRRRPKTDQPDYSLDGGFGGPVPIISKMLGNLRFFTSYRLEREMLLIPLTRDDYKDYTWSTKVNFDISSDQKVMMMLSSGKSYTTVMNADDQQFNNPAFGINGAAYWNPDDYLRSPLSIAQQLADYRVSRIFTNSWYNQSEVGYLALSGKYTEFITPTTFFEVGFEHVNREYQTGPIRKRDTSKIYEPIPGYFVDESPDGYGGAEQTLGIGDANFFFGGHSAQLRDSTKVNSYAVKFDMTSQLTNIHLVKFGVEFAAYDLNLNYGKLSLAYNDINYVKKEWNPYRFSVYAQDKIEALGFIANIGIRMDVSNPNTEWVEVDEFNKEYFSGDYPENVPDADAVFPKKKAEIDMDISPRLGISHPITENSKLYFNYGHFKQLPAYQEIFRIGRGATGGMNNFGDPNLKQAKTIAYELGYDHSLFDVLLLQLQAFYRDISNQQGYINYTSDRKGIGYNKAANNNYSDIRGFELTLKKTEGQWIRGFVTYTYQVTTSGAFGANRINDDPAEMRKIEQTSQNFYQQKPVPQPYSRASITFLTPRDFGPHLFGVQPIGNWSINVLADWRSGAWLNYNPNNAEEVLNNPNVQMVDYYNLDLRINKTFTFSVVDLTLFMEVRNLLNTKRLSGASFYDGYDQNDYLQSLHLPASQAYNNIPGDDRIGEYNRAGYFQPIEWVNNISSLPPSQANAGAYYYDKSTGKYYEHSTGIWNEVEPGRLKEVLDKKAYIDMPNNTSFNFLDPRQVFFGINLSFTL